LTNYGRKVASERIQLSNGITWKKIEIYDEGFVKIGTQHEKLLGISGETSVSRQGDLTRLFKSLNAFSTIKGARLSLTIVTDKKMHYFSPLSVSELDVESYQKILAAGTAVLDQIQLRTIAATAPETPVAPTAELGTQLKQISDLHAQGVLSDDEFAAAKAKLLGS